MEKRSLEAFVTRRMPRFCKTPRSYRLFSNDNDVAEAGHMARREFRTSRRVQWTLRASRTARAPDYMARLGPNGRYL